MSLLKETLSAPGTVASDPATANASAIIRMVRCTPFTQESVWAQSRSVYHREGAESKGVPTGNRTKQWPLPMRAERQEARRNSGQYTQFPLSTYGKSGIEYTVPNYPNYPIGFIPSI